jgi:hypothetical protein
MNKLTGNENEGPSSSRGMSDSGILKKSTRFDQQQQEKVTRFD